MGYKTLLEIIFDFGLYATSGAMAGLVYGWLILRLQLRYADQREDRSVLSEMLRTLERGYYDFGGAVELAKFEVAQKALTQDEAKKQISEAESSACLNLSEVWAKVVELSKQLRSTRSLVVRNCFFAAELWVGIAWPDKTRAEVEEEVEEILAFLDYQLVDSLFSEVNRLLLRLRAPISRRREDERRLLIAAAKWSDELNVTADGNWKRLDLVMGDSGISRDR